MFGYGLKGSKETKNDVVLKEINLRGNICGEYVEFTVSQIYENKGKENIDAIYNFPIPETAVITGFEAILGGRTIKAVVEDTDEASKIYDEELGKGVNPLTLEQYEEGVFQFSIGQILPNETVKIRFTYMDRLLYEDTSLKLLIPAILSPVPANYVEEGAFDYRDDYKLSLNLLVEPLSKINILSPTHDIDVEWEEGNNLAKVTFTDNGARLDKDFVLLLKEEKLVEASGMIYRYDEEDEEKGIIYLRLIPKLASKEEENPNNYIFLVDISESMAGEKLSEAKDALQLCIRNLSEGDSFNIVAFGSNLHYFSQFGKVPFNEENLEKASDWIDNLEADGGAELFEAVKYALNEKTVSGYSTILLFTDDLVENENEILDYVRENIGDNRIYPFGIDTSVNSFVINKLAEVGYGRPEFINEYERIDDVILRQFSRIERPQVDITSIEFGTMKVERTYPRTIDYLYDREPFSVFAIVKGDIIGSIEIKGKVGDEEYIQTIDLEGLDLKENAELIEKVWSRKRIESINERLKGERGELAQSMVNKIKELSKESGIISPETSFIMVENMEDPVLGMIISHIIPLKISEETRRKISDANFLEVPSFIYKPTNKAYKAVANEKYNEILDQKYPRESILKILAKNQFADGSFGNYGDDRLRKKFQTTSMVLLAFCLGREDINLYSNQLDKSVKYLLKSLEDKELFGKKNFAIAAVALKAALDKDMLKGNLENEVNSRLQELKQILEQKHYEHINKIIENGVRVSLRYIAAAFFNVSKDGKKVEEKLVIGKEKDSIYDLAKLGVLKAMV